MDGIRFLVGPTAATYLDGLVVDVMDYWGREALVATHPEIRGC